MKRKELSFSFSVSQIVFMNTTISCPPLSYVLQLTGAFTIGLLDLDYLRDIPSWFTTPRVFVGIDHFEITSLIY